MMIGTDYPQNHLPDDDGIGFLADVAAVLYAADSAMNIVEDRLINGMPGTATFTAPLDQPTLFTNEAGLPVSVRTGTVDSSVAMPIGVPG